MVFKFHKRLFIKLMIAFLFATAAGTVSHEAGHWLVAQHYARPGTAHISYNSVGWDIEGSLGDSLNLFAGKTDSVLKYRKEYDGLIKRYNKMAGPMMIGGPLMTILIGAAGFILLILSRRAEEDTRLSVKQWVYVFLSLFWLRSVLIATTWILCTILGYSMINDEERIAMIYGWPPWLTIIPAGILGLAIAVFIFFRYVPQAQRITFLLAAVAGCVLGWFLWFKVLGPVVLPVSG